MHSLPIFKAALIVFFGPLTVEAAKEALNATLTFTGREQH